MFGKFIATLHKDLILLWRDRAGLLLLFLMPAVLVVIITLVQNNVYRLMGETSARIIMVDQDRGELGKLVAGRMTGVELVSSIDGEIIDRDRAVKLVAAGDYQAAIVIAEDTSSRLTDGVESALKEKLFKEVEKDGAGALPQVEVLFDPTVMGGFRSSIRSGLDMILLEFEADAKMKALSRLLPTFVERELKKSAGEFADYVDVPPFELQLDMESEPLLTASTGSASPEGLTVIPTPSQHNVPAWALFGMFFIVVPLAGSLIRERQEETLIRLRSMPVAYSVILSGKVAAYILVCFAQFFLIFLIGRFLLPALGIEAFRLGAEWGGAFLVVMAASLSASCYGILLGTLCKTFEQASMFGSISVVAASAIGGVMVPVYAMPEIMQKISAISPVGWGLEAFLDILVRGGGLVAASGELLSMVLFSVAAVLGAWTVFARRTP